jgi:hypothetical protein
MIEYRIDHDRRVVFVAGHGTLTDEDVFTYQREVWSRSEVAGYDELMDMTQVREIALPSMGRARELASLSARMDAPDRQSKFAIVATSELAFGLGRLYESYRELETKSTKEVAVFRSMPEALNWLGIHENELGRSLPQAADRD